MFTTTRFDAWDLLNRFKTASQPWAGNFPPKCNGTRFRLLVKAPMSSAKPALVQVKPPLLACPSLNVVNRRGHFQALVLAPTRELANQVAEEFQLLQEMQASPF